MNNLLIKLGVSAFITCSACAAASELAGSSWQLLAIQSMDDAQGTTRIPSHNRFILQFGHDGRASLQLDCNRGMGEYMLEPAVAGTSGSLKFGPIAATRVLCPPPRFDERVARDLPFVRSYKLQDGKLYLSLMADGGIYEWAAQTAPAVASPETDKDRVAKTVQFAKSTTAAVLRGKVTGRQYIDYQVQANAGQHMTVSLKGSSSANYFNLLPPGSAAQAMAMGELSNNRFDGLLPDDGTYTVRMFLYRAAARRGETSAFTLSVGVTGAPLRPVSTQTDAVLPGTRYHASATVPCQPANTKTGACEALVVRRGFDGTATVALRWDGNSQRRILFIKGEPKAADVSQTMTSVRNEFGWRVSFDESEHFDIPRALVEGG